MKPRYLKIILMILVIVLCGCEAEGTTQQTLTTSTTGSTTSMTTQTTFTTNPQTTTQTTIEIPNELNVYFIDVDQADATLIQYKDIFILIDGGNNDKEDFMVSYLSRLGVDKLDYVVGTHPDSDHIGGLDAVIDAFEVDTIIDSGKTTTTSSYNDYIAAINRELEDGTSQLLYDEDMTFYLDEVVYFQVIETRDDYTDNNNNSVIIYLVYNETSFLFTGDMAFDSENVLIERLKIEGFSIDSTVLKSAHHGSKYSSSSEFLQYVEPEYVVISAGYNNAYGLPTEEAMFRYSLFTEEIFLTYHTCPLQNDFCSIVATTNGETIRFNASPIPFVNPTVSQSMSFVSVFEQAHLGQFVSITIKGEMNTLYDIDVVLPSGNTSGASSLNDKVSDSNGYVTWTYTFGNNSSIGTGKIIIKNKQTNEQIKALYELRK